MVKASLGATPSQVAECTQRMVKVTGPARSGKTESLVLRCAKLLEEGTPAENILVEATSAFAVQAFERRLVAAAGGAAHGVRIATAQDVCTSILSSAVAQAATGRVPRLLNSGERKFFLEDMKTLGMKRRRMQTMLDFFFAQWAALEPEEKWLLAGEESELLSRLRKFLASRGAMLPEEVGYCTARYLQSGDGEQARHLYDYVLCDDFQNLSHSEQTVLCMMASKQLLVAGNTHEALNLRSASPDANGFAAFDALRHNVEVIVLDGAYGNQAIAGYARALLAKDSMPDNVEGVMEATDAERAAEPDHARRSGVLPVKWNTPEDEMNDLTRCLRVLADARGDANADIAVVVPNRRWGRMAERALKLRGFACDTSCISGGLTGDPRDEERCAGIKAHTLLNLLANPYDVVAWRSWCGIGNYLTNSDAWSHLGEYAESRDIGLYEALEEISLVEEEPFLRASVLQQRFREGRDFIEKNAGRKGFALLGAVGGTGLAELACTEAAMCGDESAEELFELQQKAMLDPYLPEHLSAVRITTPENLCGQEAKVVVVMGAVDGLFPRRSAFEVVSTDEEREKILSADRRAFASAVAKATELLIVSHFSKADLELAEQTKMQVTRVKSEHGYRVALLRPSQFITEGQPALPGIVGGQHLAAELGIG